MKMGESSGFNRPRRVKALQEITLARCYNGR